MNLLFNGICLILSMDIALSIDTPPEASGRMVKPLVMERHSNASRIKPTEMGKEEAEQWKKEREEVRKLLIKHNEKVKKKLEKEAKECEKDEKCRQKNEEMKAEMKAREALPKEKRVPSMDITEINANSTDAEYLYQGDIQLSLEQAKIMFARDDDDDDDDDDEQGKAK